MTTRLICLFVLSVGLLATSFSSRVENRFCELNLSGKAQQALDFTNAGTRLVQEPSRRSFKLESSSSQVKRGNQRSSLYMLRAFDEALGDSWKSTVRLMHSGEQVALGAIVDSDGWIVTKASQLPISGELTCRMFDGRESIVSVISKVQEHDLALLHVPETQLTAITWDNQTPERGKWLATTDLRARPIAVGVVSAGIQSIEAKRPRLGVELRPTKGEGGEVAMVLLGSGAEEAGIRRGDYLYSVNGQSLQTSEEVIRAISTSGSAGEFIRVGVDRGEKRFEVEARLMDLTDELLDKTEMEVNGRVSARSTGFSNVFSHDTVLEPQDCGGPLVNLDGKVVGINIARAGRVSSYALPSQTVKPIVDSLLTQAKLVSTPAKPAQSKLRPIR